MLNIRKWYEKVVSWLVIFIFTIFFIFPIYWTLTSSLKSREQIYSVPIEWFPKSITFLNYVEIFREAKVGIYFLNSLFVAVFTVAGILIIGCLTAFGLSRFKFKGRRLFINSIILIRMIPILVFAIPYFVMFKTIRLTDSLIGLVIVYIAGNLPLAIWLLLGFFNKVDPAIYESAMIDGCSNFGLFRYIGIHLIKPGIITIAILVFMFSWNEFFMALVLIFSDSNKTLPIAISSMIQLHKEIPVGTIAAAGMIIMIPTILFSLFLQKYIVRGLMSSTVKG